jgi:ribonuclease Z
MEQLELVFLGTSASTPTKERNLSSIVLRYDSELLMFDCGEGTQRQMGQAKLSPAKKMKIFISHMHGDHVFGLPGLIQSMALFGRQNALEIYGPKGVKSFIQQVNETVQFSPTFPMLIHEVKPGKVDDDKRYEIHAAWADHVIPCLAYSFIERPKPGKFHVHVAKRLGIPMGPLWKKLQMGTAVKVGGKRIDPHLVVGPSKPGIKVVYASDTRPSRRIASLASNADVLIHDGTFDGSLEEKAQSDGHSTAEQAARVAKNAKVRKLILTHISARYRDPSILLKEARKVFRNTIVAEDFMRIKLSSQ